MGVGEDTGTVPCRASERTSVPSAYAAFKIIAGLFGFSFGIGSGSDSGTANGDVGRQAGLGSGA